MAVGVDVDSTQPLLTASGQHEPEGVAEALVKEGHRLFRPNTGSLNAELDRRKEFIRENGGLCGNPNLVIALFDVLGID